MNNSGRGLGARTCLGFHILTRGASITPGRAHSDAGRRTFCRNARSSVRGSTCEWFPCPERAKSCGEPLWLLPNVSAFAASLPCYGLHQCDRW